MSSTFIIEGEYGEEFLIYGACPSMDAAINFINANLQSGESIEEVPTYDDYTVSQFFILSRYVYKDLRAFKVSGDGEDIIMRIFEIPLWR